MYITSTPHIETPWLTEFAIWLVTIVLVAVGFRHAKDVISFVLDKLYQYFIQNPSS